MSDAPRPEPLPPPSTVPQVTGSALVSLGALKELALTLVHAHRAPDADPHPQPATNGN